MSADAASLDTFITPQALLDHWQAHRRLTRRVIEAFPEDQLFTYTIGGMRTFGVLAMEMLAMAEPMVHGALTDEWNVSWGREAASKAALLAEWDEATPKIAEQWAQIPVARFQETMKAFGQYEGRAYDLILYVIDNEIHHRAQGYVYLRALGIEPPPFYDRS